MSYLRGRPPGFAGGISGWINAHCAFVKSLGYGFLFIPLFYARTPFGTVSQIDTVQAGEMRGRGQGRHASASEPVARKVEPTQAGKSRRHCQQADGLVVETVVRQVESDQFEWSGFGETVKGRSDQQARRQEQPA